MSAVPKPQRLCDPKAIHAARREYCEVCGSRWGLAVHHIQSRGASGADSEENLVTLCVEHHTKAHNGQLSRETLREIVRRRENGP